MMLRTMFRNVALVASLGLAFAVSSAHADFKGSLALSSFGVSTNTGALGSSTMFTMTTLLASNPTGIGGFAPVTQFAPFTGGTFTLGVATGFSITSTGTGSSYFGTFTETAVPMLLGTTNNGSYLTSETFYILGSYIGGPVGTPSTPASFTVSFTQNGGPGTAISASGTIDIPPVAVPEPASVTMLGLGLVGFGGYALRRRRAA